MPLDDPIPLLKAQLRQQILADVGHWSQQIAADALGLDQPRMSDLERGQLKRFSLEKLIRILAKIDQRTDIHIFNVRKGHLRMFDLSSRRE